jgi:hypothetical protein
LVFVLSIHPAAAGENRAVTYTAANPVFQAVIIWIRLQNAA